MSNSPQFTNDQLWDMLQRKYPDLTDAVMPRAYQPPAGFYTAKEAAVAMAANAIGFTDYAEEARAPGYDVTCGLIENEVPTYYVSQSLLDAARATAIPPTLQVSSLNWPLKAMLFILPRGGLRLADGSDVHFLAYSLIPANSGHEVLSGWPESVSMDRDGVGVYASTTGGAGIASRMFLDSSSLAELAVSDLPTAEDDYKTPMPMANFGKEMRHLLLKLVLILSARPSLRREGTMLRPANIKKGRRKSELWTPNIIGQEYKVREETSGATGISAGVAKRLHWVRGHLRQQPYGPRENPRYETIWIEPFMSGRA